MNLFYHSPKDGNHENSFEITRRSEPRILARVSVIAPEESRTDALNASMARPFQQGRQSTSVSQVVARLRGADGSFQHESSSELGSSGTDHFSTSIIPC